jgi:hypothetical protein
MSLTHGVTWHGDEIKAAETRGAIRGLYLWAEHVLEEANRLVPVAPSGGTLMRSGVAHKPEGGKLEAAVSYDTPYAVRQHEELDWVHTRPGAQAKYLETPMNSSKDVGMRLVQREIRSGLKT